MNLTNKTILLISPESWDHLFISKHHYAVHLGKKANKVFFLNPPSGLESVDSTKYANVFSVNYTGFSKGLRFYPSFIQRHFIVRKFDELQGLCGVKFDIVWSFDNSVFFDFSALPDNLLKICHIVDLNQGFQIKTAATTADYCFCTTEFLQKKISVYNDKTFKINHGYSLPIEVPTAAIKLPGKNAIKAIYAGNLDIQYIDWNLLEKLILDNPSVDFYFVGSRSEKNKNMVSLSQLSNFYYLGRVSHEQLIRYLEVGDLMLLVYKADEFREQLGNPHKMMEYLGSGKMIVATFTHEYTSLAENNLILMSNHNEEFSSLFKKALTELEVWNCDEKQSLRKKIAIDNSYSRQIDRIEVLIGKKTAHG